MCGNYAYNYECLINDSIMCLILTVGSTTEMVLYCIVLYVVYQCTLNIFISYCITVRQTVNITQM